MRIYNICTNLIAEYASKITTDERSYTLPSVALQNTTQDSSQTFHPPSLTTVIVQLVRSVYNKWSVMRSQLKLPQRLIIHDDARVQCMEAPVQGWSRTGWSPRARLLPYAGKLLGAPVLQYLALQSTWHSCKHILYPSLSYGVLNSPLLNHPMCSAAGKCCQWRQISITYNNM